MINYKAMNIRFVLKQIVVLLCYGVLGCTYGDEQTNNSATIVRYAWVDPTIESWDLGLMPDLAPKGTSLSGSELGERMSDAINEKHMYSCVELYVDLDKVHFSLGSALVLWCDFFEQFEVPYIVTLGWSENDEYKAEEIKHYYRSGGWDRIEWHKPDEFILLGLSPSSPSKKCSFDEMLKTIREAQGGKAYIITLNPCVLDESPIKLGQLVEVLNSKGRKNPYQIRAMKNSEGLGVESENI